MLVEAILLALGIAVSPLPVAVVVLLLLSDRASSVGRGFAIGFVIGIATAATTAAVVPTWLPTARLGSRASAVACLRVAAGAVLVTLGVGGLVRRARRRGLPSPPAWLEALDRITPSGAFTLGLLLSAANPKNLPLALAAGLTIGGASDQASVVIGALVVFVGVATTPVLVPVVAHQVAPRRVAPLFARLRGVLALHGRTAVTLVLLGTGTLVLAEGLRRL